jgi:hypothetical protein
MSLPYHIGNGWFGGMLPLLATAFVAGYGDIYFGLWYPIGVAVMTFIIGLIFLRDNRRYRHRVRRADAERRSLGQARAAAVPPPGIFRPETLRNSGAFSCGPEAAISFDCFVPLDGVTKVRGARGGFVSREVSGARHWLAARSPAVRGNCARRQRRRKAARTQPPPQLRPRTAPRLHRPAAIRKS